MTSPDAPAESPAAAPAPSSGAPRHTPPAAVLDDLELLLLGAYAPLTGFLGSADTSSVLTAGTLADGTPWPEPILLPVPADVADAAARAGSLVLTDDEGAPAGTVTVAETWQDAARGDDLVFVSGPVLPPPAQGASVRGAHPQLRVRPPAGPGAPVLVAQPLVDAIGTEDLAGARAEAARLGGGLLLLPLVGAGQRGELAPDALVRGLLAAADDVADARVVPVALPRHDGAPGGPGAPDLTPADLALVGLVAARYGATHVLPLPRRPAALARPLESVPAPFARELRRGRRSDGTPGVVVLLTGFSGSGKSTIARALRDALLVETDRDVTLLDGDVVRRALSAGLGFSRADREANVARIGFVAAEVARHGGLTVCAPIAPYASTRAEVRAEVEQQGRFLLVHVSTPLEVCEARDRKGLYARARAGEIEGFTGISDPYEVPLDADLRLDTTHTSAQDAVEAILDLLVERDWVRRTTSGRE